MTTLRAARRRRGIGNAHSECQANPLMRNPSKFSEFSELALKDKRIIWILIPPFPVQLRRRSEPDRSPPLFTLRTKAGHDGPRLMIPPR